MNRKGFTLVELLATILILALLLGIGTYSIISIINSSKQKNYELLINNTKSAAETYYQECKFSNNSGIPCTDNNKDGKYETSLGDLVTYGYLKGNDTLKNGNNKGKYTIVNPNDKVDISNCSINISYDNGKVKVTAITSSGSCPTEY